MTSLTIAVIIYAHRRGILCIRIFNIIQELKTSEFFELEKDDIFQNFNFTKGSVIASLFFFFKVNIKAISASSEIGILKNSKNSFVFNCIIKYDHALNISFTRLHNFTM